MRLAGDVFVRKDFRFRRPAREVLANPVDFQPYEGFDRRVRRSHRRRHPNASSARIYHDAERFYALAVDLDVEIGEWKDGFINYHGIADFGKISVTLESRALQSIRTFESARKISSPKTIHNTHSMKSELITSLLIDFESIRQESDGVEFWSARDLQKVL